MNYIQTYNNLEIVTVDQHKAFTNYDCFQMKT